jgi:hypothetical protein
MTVEQIREEVNRIRDLAAEEHDHHAHLAQDKLYLSVLRVIADGDLNAALMAAAALEVDEIEFTRWYS